MKQGPALLRGLTKTEPGHGAGRGPCNLITHHGAHTWGATPRPHRRKKTGALLFTVLSLSESVHFVSALYCMSLYDPVCTSFIFKRYTGVRALILYPRLQNRVVAGPPAQEARAVFCRSPVCLVLLSVPSWEWYWYHYLPWISCPVCRAPWACLISPSLRYFLRFLQLLLSDVWRGPVSIFSSPWCF